MRELLVIRRIWPRIGAVALVWVAAWAPPAYGQADYRNLDPGRPLAVEDAQPLEFRAMEFQFGVPRLVQERGDRWLAGFEPEWKWGFAKDAQFGVTTEFVVARGDGRTLSGLRDTQFHLLYNLNQETRRLPAIAFRPEFTIGSGGLGSRHEHAALKLILSKTLHRNRVHLNGSYTLGPTQPPERGGDLVSRYFYGFGYERTLPLKFLVLLADVYARKPIDHERTEIVFDAGARWQLTPAWVLDAGVSSNVLLRSAGPDVGFTFGVSHVFSFRALFPTGK